MQQCFQNCHSVHGFGNPMIHMGTKVQCCSTQIRPNAAILPFCYPRIVKPSEFIYGYFCPTILALMVHFYKGKMRTLHKHRSF